MKRLHPRRYVRRRAKLRVTFFSSRSISRKKKIFLWLKLRLKLFSENVEKKWEELSILKQDFIEFWHFFCRYIGKKTKIAGEHFEGRKGQLVSLLVVKRGRYSQSFLNLSFFMLTVAAFVVAPVIASSYPGVDEESLAQFSAPSAVATSLDQSELGTATLISAKPRDSVITYTVQKGDTLSTIAQTFGVSEDTIKWASGLKSDKITVGQKLKIPPVTGVIHTVREGDTVYGIAKKYKTDPQQIVNFPFNDFEDLDTFALRIGQVLIIPNGVMPQAPAIARAAPVPQIVKGKGGTYIWPTQGSISQYPVWYHMALDIANKTAPAILSSRAGKVTYSGCLKWGYGCHIIIDHGDGYQTLYGHLSRIGVSVGAKVGQGQVIGRMGSTGRSTGTHLHFEIRRNGSPINPLSFLGK